MRDFFSILGICAALVMCAVSAAMNYLFLASLGKTPIEGHVLGAASAAADVLKALLPFFIAWSWAAGRILAAVSGTLAFLFFAGFSLLSAIGFAADNRGVLVDTRQEVSAEYNRVQRSIGDAESRRNGLPDHRPAAVVIEEIGAHRQHRRWDTTKACMNATEAESRAFCADYFRLRAELAAATEAARLSAQIGSLQSEALKLRENGAGQDSDPQVSLLSGLTGRAQESVRLALIVTVALLVEIGASLGLFLASGHGSGSSRPILSRPPAQPHGCIEDFALEALIPSGRGALAMQEVRNGYMHWCARQGHVPMPAGAFATAFSALADAVEIPRAPDGWRGIALKHDKAAFDMVSL